MSGTRLRAACLGLAGLGSADIPLIVAVNRNASTGRSQEKGKLIGATKRTEVTQRIVLRRGNDLAPLIS